MIKRELLSQHLSEIEANLAVWSRKPLLRKVYSDLYVKLTKRLNNVDAGVIVELGSGIGHLKSYIPTAFTSDIFRHDWIDISCSAYDLPFRDASVTNLVLFDVFHHLEHPFAFMKEAERVLIKNGTIVLVDPYMSLLTLPIYGLLHHEPVALRGIISMDNQKPQTENYYAAQGNATRVFFNRDEIKLSSAWYVESAEAFACFSYLLSGGFSRRSFYPSSFFSVMKWLDSRLSRWPKIFAGRCVVEIVKL
jgi:SAM-dependent methyltransferase